MLDLVSACQHSMGDSYSKVVRDGDADEIGRARNETRRGRAWKDLPELNCISFCAVGPCRPLYRQERRNLGGYGASLSLSSALDSASMHQSEVGKTNAFFD